MHLIPLALGIVAIVIGIAMVAYGIPINEFGTGNTLIAAGTTAVSAGFILLGLWVAVLQLQRLSGMPEPRSARPPSGRGAAPNADRVRHQGEVGGLPQFEDSRLAPEPASDREPASGPASQPPAERMSWLPREPEPEPEPRGERLSTGCRLGSRQEESSWEMFAPSRNSGPARERSFEAIWPSDRPREGRETAPPGDRPERPPEPGPTQNSGAQPGTILKSGVINGMAYTLYTDGSIEAELPQGTLRFGSLDELRDYLAGNA